MMMGELVLSSREAAAALHVSPSTLARWRHVEKYGPPYIQMGGRIMYRPFAIQQWLTACTIKPGEDVA